MGEQTANLLGRGIRGDIVVMGGTPEQLVANAATRKIGHKPRLAERPHDLNGEAVLFFGHDFEHEGRD